MHSTRSTLLHINGKVSIKLILILSPATAGASSSTWESMLLAKYHSKQVSLPSLQDHLLSLTTLHQIYQGSCPHQWLIGWNITLPWDTFGNLNWTFLDEQYPQTFSCLQTTYFVLEYSVCVKRVINADCHEISVLPNGIIHISNKNKDTWFLFDSVALWMTHLSYSLQKHYWCLTATYMNYTQSILYLSHFACNISIIVNSINHCFCQWHIIAVR